MALCQLGKMPFSWRETTKFNESCVYLYSKSARVCAKWQWNPRDCVTGLHDRQSRECNPVTPVECVLLSFRTHPCVLAFITHILCLNGIEMTFVCLILFTLRYIFFTFRICFIVLMNLGETCHFKRRDLVTVWRMMLLLCCHHSVRHLY